jgi:hypothetical protein
LSIDIGIIRELAITASLGVAVIIFTNLVLLPVIASYLDYSKTKRVNPDDGQTEDGFTKIREMLVKTTDLKVSKIILAVSAVLFVFGFIKSNEMQIGDLHEGAPSLHEEARYNQDTFLITDRFSISVDILKIIVEAEPEACTYHDTMERIDRFQWKLQNVDGVQSAVSLSSIAQEVNAGSMKAT